MKIWIINHYASNMYIDQGGRHYSFAKYLMRKGHEVRIFCASTIHNNTEVISTEGRRFKEIVDKRNNIPFVVIKATAYSGNGFSRILNMITFYFNVMWTLEKQIGLLGKPDIILASSVHPLSLLAGLKIGRKNNIPCICEIRDLWPESLIAYGIITRKTLVAKYLYRLEKSIYERADGIIFTVDGGKEYIVEREWDIANGGLIDLNKVQSINNGVDIEEFNKNRDANDTAIEGLHDRTHFNVVYAGSIRKTNNVGVILDAAKIIWQEGDKRIRVYIYGAGDLLDELVEQAASYKIENIKFMGRVSKEMIPAILSNSDLNIMDIYQSDLFRYGTSPNKLFEYLASGKPIVSGLICNHDIVVSNECGITLKAINPTDLAEGICYFSKLDEHEYERYAENSLRTAYQYDYAELTNKLEKFLEKVIRHEN